VFVFGALVAPRGKWTVVGEGVMSIYYQRLPQWKYRLEARYQVSVGFYKRRAERGNDFVWLDHGLLTISKGYAWDGPSGPALDTRTWMRASLVHDALYQLLREDHLPPEMRKTVDGLMREHLLQDGMNRFRAWYSYHGVRLFGAPSAKPVQGARIFRAP
jgi:hypothetical protein